MLPAEDVALYGMDPSESVLDKAGVISWRVDKCVGAEAPPCVKLYHLSVPQTVLTVSA